MSDLTHYWGSDLAWSSTGDLATSGTPAVTEQRLLRRLLTTELEYIWQADYGASLASFVGQPGAALAINAAIRGQLAKEAAVAQTPAPTIEVTPDASGSLYVNIRYADAATGMTGAVTLTA